MLFLPACLALVPCVVLVLTWLVSTLSASRPAVELPRVRTRSTKDFRRSRLPERMTFAPVLALSSIWEKDFLAPSMSRSTLDAFNCMSSGPRWQT